MLKIFLIVLFVLFVVGRIASARRANRRNVGYITNFHVDTRMPVNPSLRRRKR